MGLHVYGCVSSKKRWKIVNYKENTRPREASFFLKKTSYKDTKKLKHKNTFVKTL